VSAEKAESGELTRFEIDSAAGFSGSFSFSMYANSAYTADPANFAVFQRAINVS
jgi:hypothetical protein